MSLQSQFGEIKDVDDVAKRIRGREEILTDVRYPFFAFAEKMHRKTS